ncbi:hypothetical protein H2203_007702 [Taxawa tesnikishii (nom. ined.)]|nr:hypothetical protein H2203_007702 [Dothideales sp. JES 119]
MPPPLQITIPTTSTASGNGKPYTLYHITLTLPLRTHEIRKRFSEFLSLHTSLIEQTSQPPPASLPAKSWFGSTVNNTHKTEERRKQLEAYLQAILEAQDPRWRACAAWRGWLDLPSGVLGSESKGKGRQSSLGGGRDMMDERMWLDVHRDVKTNIHNARLTLKKREGAKTAAEQHGLTADAKAHLVRAATGIARLEDGLKQLGKEKGDDGGWGGRDLSGAQKTGRVLGGPMKETERTRELDNNGVLQMQKQVMREQEEDVLELGKAVSRMKEMGIMINEELVVQNGMLGLLDQDVDRVQGKIDVAKKRIGKIH